MEEKNRKDIHTFAICAYKESPYLEECIQSLKKQTVQTNILLATSTPNKFIEGLCEKYQIPLYINHGEGGITQDWNFAYSKCNTKYITIAHQDDVYAKEYAKKVIERLEKSKKPLIAFTDYYELRDGEVTKTNKLLKVKRIMLFPLRAGIFKGSRFVRRRILSLGSPICCPSVTFAKQNLPEVVFQHGYRASEDWQAWEILSKLKGDFLYCCEPLTYHRIHQDSETSKILEDNARIIEDNEMFCKFWPKPIANLLTKFYSSSEDSNKLEQ